ncbi:MAG TPA: hypothetical protein VK750_05035, partial [Cytophagaceae bacterium]|nr:hypothetical protein [Cytophagaceae bacterium]
KRIEAALSKALPDQWKTLYGEVTFSDVSYSVALARGKRNQWVMNEIMNDPLLDLNYWEDSEVWTMLIDKVKKLMKESTL